MPILFANSQTEFLPPLSRGTAAVVIVATLLAVLLLCKLLSPANAVSRNWGLWVLRGTILSIVIGVLANPVRIDESPGPVQRPEMFYLLDTSASMQM